MEEIGMEMYIPKSFRQIIAMILCLAMMMLMIAVPGNATELTEPAGDAVVVSAEAPAEVPTEAPTKEAAVESADVPEDTENAKTVNAAAVITIADGISIPAYSGGTTSKTLEYDCGNGAGCQRQSSRYDRYLRQRPYKV
jgi:hypothetical protein